MYPDVVDRDTPLQFLKIACGFLVAGGVAVGFQLHAGKKNLFEALVNGIPQHAQWHWNDGFSWYFTLLGIGYVALLSGARRWLWMIMDKP